MKSTGIVAIPSRRMAASNAVRQTVLSPGHPRISMGHTIETFVRRGAKARETLQVLFLDSWTRRALPRTFPNLRLAGKRDGKASRLVAAGDRPAAIQLSKFYLTNMRRVGDCICAVA